MFLMFGLISLFPLETSKSCKHHILPAVSADHWAYQWIIGLGRLTYLYAIL